MARSGTVAYRRGQASVVGRPKSAGRQRSNFVEGRRTAPIGSIGKVQMAKCIRHVCPARRAIRGILIQTYKFFGRWIKAGHWRPLLACQAFGLAALRRFTSPAGRLPPSSPLRRSGIAASGAPDRGGSGHARPSPPGRCRGRRAPADLQSRIAGQAAADQARQRRAVVGDRDHLRNRQEVRHRDRDVPPQALPLQRLEQARAQPAGRQHVHVPEPFVLLPRQALVTSG